MKSLKTRFVLLGIAVAAVPSMASAQLVYFDNRADFRAAASAMNMVSLGIETFEESNLAPFKYDSLDDPLQSGVTNLGNITGSGFANGLTGLNLLKIQSNMGMSDSETLQPQGEDGLAVMSMYADENISDVVVGATPTNATDFIYMGRGTYATGGDLLAFSPFTGALELDIYDVDNNWLDTVYAEGDKIGTNFFGVISEDPFVKIGRINIWQLSGYEGMDNIEAWGPNSTVPEPATMTALAAGSLALLRRRRRQK